MIITADNFIVVGHGYHNIQDYSSYQNIETTHIIIQNSVSSFGRYITVISGISANPVGANVKVKIHVSVILMNVVCTALVIILYFGHDIKQRFNS